MAQRLNKKMVVGLTVLGMAVTTAAGIVMVVSLPARDPEPVALQAREMAGQGDYVQATRLFQKAAHLARSGGADSPESNSYLVEAGETAFKSGDARQALGLWQRVILNNPQHIEAQQKIVELELELAELGMRPWSSVQTEAQKLLTAAKARDVTSPAGLHALGRALIEQRGVRRENAEEGERLLLEAVEADASNPVYAASLTDFYLREAQNVDSAREPGQQHARIQQAAEIYKTLIEHPAEDPLQQAKAYLNRGQFYATEIVQKAIPEAVDRALADLEEAVRLAPDNVDVLMGMGTYWRYRKSLAARDQAPSEEIDTYRQKAREYFERAIKADYDHYVGYLSLAQLYSEDGRFDDALKVLEERLVRGIRRDHYLGFRNRQYMAHTRDMAFRVHLAIAGEIPRRFSSSQEQERQLKLVIESLEQLYRQTVADLPTGENHPITLLMRGRLQILQEQFHAALTTLKQAQELIGGPSPEVNRLMADLHMRTNAPADAAEALRVVVAANPGDASAWAMLANALNATGAPQDALDAVERALAVNPEHAEALRARIRAYQLQQNYAAIAELQQRAGGGDTPQEKLGRAALLVLQAGEGQMTPETAATVERLLREVLEAEPLNLAALRQLVSTFADNPERSHEVAGLLDQARAVVAARRAELAQADDPDAARAELDRVAASIDVMAIAVDHAASDDEKFQRMEELIGRGEDPFLVAVDRFSLYRSRPDRVQDALAALQEAHRLRPDNAGVLEQLFQFALATGEFKLGEETLNKLLALDLDPSGGHFYRGQFYMANTELPNHLAEAARSFRNGLTAVPTYVEGYVLLGRALSALNQLDEARTAFQEAHRRSPRNPGAAVGLAMIATRQGDDAARQRYLLLCGQVASAHPWVQAELQEMADRQDPVQGITRREQHRTRNPRDTENLLRLADLYNLTGRSDDARRTLEECRELAPQDLRVARIYANFLISQDPPEPQAARQMLQQLVHEVEGPPLQKAAAQLVLAAHLRNQAFLDAPDVPEVEEVHAAYTRAAEISGEPAVLMEIGNHFAQTGDASQAESWYRRAVAAATGDAAREAQQQARRLLIQTLLQAVDFDRLDEIEGEIDAYRNAFREDPLALLFRAEFYSASGRDVEAMEYYNAFLSRRGDPVVGHFQRGLAHFRRSQWTSAIQDLRDVKRMNPDFAGHRPRFLLARALENAGQLDEAVAELQSLLDENPDSFPVFQQLFSVYLKTRRFDSAETMIAGRARQQPDNPTWDYYRLQIAAARFTPDRVVPLAEAAVARHNFVPQLVNMLLNLYLEAQNYEGLIRFVSSQLPSQQHNPPVLLKLAAAYSGTRDAAAAVETYSRVLEAPGANLGVFGSFFQQDLARRLDAGAALEVIEKILAEHPHNRPARFMLAMIQRKQNNLDALEQNLRQLLDTASEEQMAREGLFLMRDLAAHLYTRGHFEECRTLYQQILEREPNDIFSLNNLAYLLMDEMNDPRSALPYARRVAALSAQVEDPAQQARLLDTLGWNLVLLGNYDEGIARLRQAIEKETSLATLHYHAAEAFYRRANLPATRNKQSDLNEAVTELQQAHKLIMEAGQDDENLLDKIIVLGEKLGVELESLPDPTERAEQAAAH